MNEMLTDDDLTALLGEAASAYPVPDRGPVFVLEKLGDAEPRMPWLRRRGVQLTAVAAAVLLAAGLSQSLGGPGASPKQTTASRSSAPASDSLVGKLGPVPQPTPASASQYTTSQDTRRSKYAPSVTSNLGTAPVGDGAISRVVKTGSISLVVDDGKVSTTVDKLQRVATQARGAISGQQTREFGDNPSATVTMRVPVAAFDGVLLQLRSKGFGAEVVSAESSGRDVTAQYADTEAQIASLRAARARFLTILAGAKTIGETLTVQQRVDDVQGQIDRLEGQRRVLGNQSDLATLTVTVEEKADAVLKTTEPGGLSKAWSDAEHGFTSGVEGLIARSGRALLVLLVAALALVVARFGWTLARRRLV